MKIRDDIDLDNTWIIADTHFGHENIVGFCFRPEDHEQVMIAQWRATVPDDATVLHLGDLCYGHNGGNTRFRKLTSKELTGGRKLLIAGNHDNQRYSFYRDCGFKIISPFAVKFFSRLVEFNHYPTGRTHMPWFDEAWRVHGHIHNNGYTRDGFVPYLRNHINVSVEQLRYTPANLRELLDAAILGKYNATTDEQLEDARRRRREASTQ